MELLEMLLIPILATPSNLAPGTLYGPGTPYEDSEAYEKAIKERDERREKERENIPNQQEEG